MTDEEILAKTHYDLSDLMAIMDRLTAPDGCPWDREQTHESIRINMIEEAYEAVEAVNNNDIANMREEMGDVLLQVVFNCDMAKRKGTFTLDEVVDELCKKLVFRHTHIFGKNKAANSEDALKFWELAKAEEKKSVTLPSQLDRLPTTFPALLKVQKAVKKVVKAGGNINKQNITAKLNECAANGDSLSALFYASVLATLDGVDCEVELLKKTDEFIDSVKKADGEGRLDKVEEYLD